MEFSEVMLARHSARSFKNTPVAKEYLVKILELASHAPSWVNAQEWKVFVASGDTLNKIKAEYTPRSAGGETGKSDLQVQHRENWSESAQKNMQEIGALVEASRLGKEFGDSQHIMYNAPAIMIFCLPRSANEFAVLDMGGFYQSAMLAAQSLGIATIPSYNLVKYPDLLRKYLNISDDYKIVIGIALGYEDDAPINSFKPGRMSVSEFAEFRD